MTMALDCAINSEPIPGYRLLEPIGKGGYGEVWKCLAPGGLIKAIKIVPGTANMALQTNSGAEQELQALEHIKTIRHPFLLSMERVELVDGDLLIVTELADRSLHDLLSDYRKNGLIGIPRGDLIGYLREAAEVLDLMNHEYNLQHLDIKPRNIFLVGRHVKVADFGMVSSLAEMSGAAPHAIQLGAVTPLYAAPESFMGKISKTSDQYSLAVAYCEMLTGVAPFDGKNFRHLAMQHLQAQPNLNAVPECDHAAVLRALAKDPAQRFPTCQDFINALQPAPPVSQTNIALSKASFPEIDLGAASTLHPKMATAHEIDMSVTPMGSARIKGPDRESNRLPAAVAPGAGAGTDLNNYRLLECVGRLPGGELWKGQTLSGQPCTIRFIFDVEGDAEEGEGRASDRLRAIRHPALASLDIELVGPRLALIHCGGDQTVVTRLKECQLAGMPGIPRFELLQYLRVAAEAIDALFLSHRLQHLSLTPRTLYLVDEQVRLADFGLVELFWLPAGHQPGASNARYAPPELFEHQITRAADQYSLALIFQELLTGVHPFRNMNPRQMATPRLRGKPDLGMLPATDRAVVMRAMNIDADRRFDSCTEFITALEEASNSTGAAANPMPLRPSAQGTLAQGGFGQPGSGLRPSAFGARPAVPTPGTLRPTATGFRPPSHPLSPQMPAPGGDQPRVAVVTRRPLSHLLASGNEAIGKMVDSAAGQRTVREFNHFRYLVKAGVSMEHRCFARLVPHMIRLKLDSFRDQWCADLVEAKGTTFVYHVPVKGSVLERFFGVWPNLIVRVQCKFPQSGVPLAEISIEITAKDCGKGKTADMLNRGGPALIESIRTYLEVNTDRRVEERLPFAQAMTIYPVYEGEQVGEAIAAQAHDISLHGMGVFMPYCPPVAQVCIQMAWESPTMPLTLLANVVSSQPCPDGRHAIGLQFLQNTAY